MVPYAPLLGYPPLPAHIHRAPRLAVRLAAPPETGRATVRYTGSAPLLAHCPAPGYSSAHSCINVQSPSLQERFQLATAMQDRAARFPVHRFNTVVAQLEGMGRRHLVNNLACLFLVM